LCILLGPVEMYRSQTELANIKTDDVVSRDRYPQMKIHPLTNDSFLALSQAAEVAGKTAPTQSQWAQQGPARLLYEVQPFDFTSAELFR
jgi:hypothetical protein